MKTRVWTTLPRDSAALFNPALLSIITLRAVQGAIEETRPGLPWEIAYLVAPMCLDSEIRRSLTMRINTPLVTWTADHAAIRATVPSKASAIAPLVTEGLETGLRADILALNGSALVLGKQKMTKAIPTSTTEVVQIQKAAKFLGRWLTVHPNSSAVLNLFGVRP